MQQDPGADFIGCHFSAFFEHSLMNPTPSLPPCLQSALDASADGNSELALELFAQAAQELPESALPAFLMASEWASLGNMEKAEECFAAAILIAPDLHLARYQLGLLQFSSGRAAMAFVTWQPLLALDNQSPLFLWVQGFSALADDRFAEAKKLFLAGVAANDSNPPMSNDIQKIIAEIDKILEANSTIEDGAEALEDAEKDSHFLLSNYQQQNLIH
jgi:tetratricopeptide (TPR) repeat protein